MELQHFYIFRSVKKICENLLSCYAPVNILFFALGLHYCLSGSCNPWSKAAYTYSAVPLWESFSATWH